MTGRLTEAVQKDPPNIDEIARIVGELYLPSAIEEVNRGFSSRRLAKQAREKEPLPTDPPQLSSYRTRLGTMLEYALSTALDGAFRRGEGDALTVAFAFAHEYPDFYVRNPSLEPLLKIEMKAVDAESDEKAARFGTPTSEINAHRDLLLFIGWEWAPTGEEHEAPGEYPYIFKGMIVPAMELARERDRRVIEIGGKIEGDKVLVPSTKAPGTFVKDPGNYGKFERIVQGKRRNDPSLGPWLREFVAFVDAVTSRTQSRAKDKSV